MTHTLDATRAAAITAIVTVVVMAAACRGTP